MFNFIRHILVHLVIVNTLEQSCTLHMNVKIKCIIIIIIINPIGNKNWTNIGSKNCTNIASKNCTSVAAPVPWYMTYLQ